jgi:hypothetical protein
VARPPTAQAEKLRWALGRRRGGGGNRKKERRREVGGKRNDGGGSVAAFDQLDASTTPL